MRDAKSGQWWVTEPQRALANNSATYDGPVEVGQFMEEWLALYKSKSGERGIFNRQAARSACDRMSEWRKGENILRDSNHKFGTNPCSEIVLRDCEFCNLTEIVVREGDTKASLMRKARLATILGTWQSTLTDFRYLASSWKKNCEEERLLGVSMTGIMDCKLTNGKGGNRLDQLLFGLRDEVVNVNRDYANTLGIPQSAATTCVKPSGTVSQLVDAASGIHARHNPYYIRTVRADNKDPLCQFMKDKGFPHEACVMKPDNVTVFSFPVKAPDNSIFRTDMSAIEQLELWLVYQKQWCEHKPSVTITVKENEWPEVGSWVWNNLDYISGISFLPHSDHTYKQAPYQDCDVKEYKELLKQLPSDVDWTELKSYEEQDNTAGSQTMACSGDSCEVVDLTS
jgi:ribonucleoside-diphosphate reductase alpha chain